MDELRGAEKEGQELIVVQTPDAMRSRWFEVIRRL